MASHIGRVFRVCAGLVLMAMGWLVEGVIGVALILLGAIPVISGILDLCLLTAMLGGPLRGSDVRNEQEEGK